MARPIRIVIYAHGFEALEARLAEFGPGFIAAMVGPALGRSAAVLRRTAKRRNFIFRDRRGPRDGTTGPGVGRWRSLRQSIRSARIPAWYGGRHYRRGRAAVFAGGPGAKQAYLVEAGHGGPRPAKPYPYLKEAAMRSDNEQEDAYTSKLRELFPVLVRRFSGGGGGGRRRVTSVYARTVSRRGRGRFR